MITVEELAQLQEFVPYAQKHPHASKGYVVGMRRKNARDELYERDVYLSKHQVIEFIERHIAAGQQGATNPAADAIQYHNAVGPIDAMSAAFSAMDNSDTELEAWPQRAIDALAFAGWAVVPYALPYEVLGEAGISGIFETGNPKHGWDWLVAKTRIGPHGPPAATPQPSKDAGAVPLSDNPQPLPTNPHLSDKSVVPLPEPDVDGTVRHPELHICYTAPVHYTKERLIEYGDAREAAALIKSRYSNSSNTCVDSSAGRADTVPEGWTVDRNEGGEIRVVGPDGGMHPRYDRGPQSERLLHALATALIDSEPAPQQMATQGKAGGVAAKKYPDDGAGDDDAYNRGWNDCIDAMLANPPDAGVTRKPGFMCIDSGRVAEVERHDWPNTPGFRNVWIVTATEPAPQPKDAER